MFQAMGENFFFFFIMYKIVFNVIRIVEFIIPLILSRTVKISLYFEYSSYG